MLTASGAIDKARLCIIILGKRAYEHTDNLFPQIGHVLSTNGVTESMARR